MQYRTKPKYFVIGVGDNHDSILNLYHRVTSQLLKTMRTPSGRQYFVLSWELVLLGYDRRAEDSEAELPGSSVSVVKASSVAAPESNSIVGSSLRFDASQEL